ncbi:MAG: hypothetical protein ACLQFI_02895 [Methylocella sp.]
MATSSKAKESSPSAFCEFEISRRRVLWLLASGLVPSAAWPYYQGTDTISLSPEPFGTSLSKLSDFSSQLLSSLTNLATKSTFDARNFRRVTIRSPIPSAVTDGVSVFDRAHLAYGRHVSSGASDVPANEVGMERYYELASTIAVAESDAWTTSKQAESGRWAKDARRGPYEARQWKCNVAVSEWAMAAGLYPFYTKDGSFANTDYMVKHPDSFMCWRPTNEPKNGRVGVYANHTFIVGKPDQGEGISAMRAHTQDMQHFWKDGDSYKAVIQRHGEPPEKSQKPVSFFEYYCPDQKLMDRFIYD